MQVTVTDSIALTSFWLVFTRWLAIGFQLPIFDHSSIPVQIKVLGALLISYAFFPIVQNTMVTDLMTIGVDNFWYLTIMNTVIGLTIGFFVRAIMNLYIAAGSMITQQIGFGAVRYFDPERAEQTGPFENLIQWTMLVLIISTGALTPMFKGVIHSFDSIKLMSLSRLATSPEFFIALFKSLFTSALTLAAPLIYTNMLIMTVLGIISRTVPQMNVLMVSFVVNIGLGLLVFLATSDEFFHVAYQDYVKELGQWFLYIK